MDLCLNSVLVFSNDQEKLLSVDKVGTMNIANSTGVALGGAFSNAKNLLRIKGKLKGKNLRDLSCLFCNAYRLEEVNISKLDTDDVTNMNGMFYNTYALFDLRGIRDLDTSKVTNMGGMFYNARSLIYLGGISNFDTSKVVYMNGMFESMHKLVGLNLSNFDTRNVRNMSTMFYDTNMAYLDLSSFKTGNLTHLNGTFARMQKHYTDKC